MEEIHSPNDIFSLSVKIIAYISLLLLPLGAIAGPKSPTCSTSECHANIKNFTFLHGPVKANGCTVCHQLGEGHLNLPAKHPQLLAIPKGNSTCLVCHDDKSGAGFKTIHKPLQEQGCTTCHNPHGSNFPKLQKQKSVADLCLSCHKEMKTQAHAGHGPVLMENTSCLTCHGPHFSHEKKLLKAPENKLCFQCHNKEITVAGHVVSNIEKKTKEEFKHPPVAEGKCDSCHAVHGSAEKSFLKKPFATTDFSLCLECHKKDLAGASFTDSQTGFRNGNQNLHFF
ncbi:MAG: cytochrome c3 family protein, partial [Bdellovibrionota bacterium]